MALYNTRVLHTVRDRPQELCESRGGCPGLPSLISLLVSVDVVKQHFNNNNNRQGGYCKGSTCRVTTWTFPWTIANLEAVSWHGVVYTFQGVGIWSDGLKGKRSKGTTWRQGAGKWPDGSNFNGNRAKGTTWPENVS